MSSREGVELRALGEAVTGAPPLRAAGKTRVEGAAVPERAWLSIPSGQLPSPNAVTLVAKPDRRRQPREKVTAKDIARRAYDLYLMRGCEPGHDVEDWLQAERELWNS